MEVRNRFKGLDLIDRVQKKKKKEMGLRTGDGWEKSQGVQMFFLEEVGVEIGIRIAPHVEGWPVLGPGVFHGFIEASKRLVQGSY